MSNLYAEYDAETLSDANLLRSYLSIRQFALCFRGFFLASIFIIYETLVLVYFLKYRKSYSSKPQKIISVEHVSISDHIKIAIITLISALSTAGVIWTSFDSFNYSVPETGFLILIAVSFSFHRLLKSSYLP